MITVLINGMVEKLESIWEALRTDDLETLKLSLDKLDRVPNWNMILYAFSCQSIKCFNWFYDRGLFNKYPQFINERGHALAIENKKFIIASWITIKRVERLLQETKN